MDDLDVLAVLQAGLGHHQAGRLEDAERNYRRVLEIEPEHADALHLLGVLVHGRGNSAHAVDLIERAIRVEPGRAHYFSHLGIALQGLGRVAEAERSYRRALALDARLAQAHNNLGVILMERGPLDEAERCFEEALACEPGYAEAHYNLGNVLKVLERYAESERCYRKALELDPGFVAAHSNLGAILIALERLEEAEQSYRDALALRPDDVDANASLGVMLQKQGHVVEAEQCYRRALKTDPDRPEVHSNLIFILDLLPQFANKEHQEERRRWYRLHAQRYAATIKPHRNTPDPARRLRVGYVSADFCRHSACYVFGPVVCGHDRAAFEVVCYSGTTPEDEATARVKASVDGWHSTLDMSDEALAEQIRADGIDILVDLSGHTAGNRLLVFARKPAPVQVTAWGHATGTGLGTMDYLLADPVFVPAEDRADYAEEVVDLPCVICYQPPEHMPAVGPLPAQMHRRFTFGCINRIEKISDAAIRVWGTILGALPAAGLVLKDRRLDDAESRDQMLGRLGSAGIAPDRVRLLGFSPQAEHLKVYHQIDVGLDPFPHGGGVSTVEALNMGVPIVTQCGRTNASRVSAAILAALGMQDWVGQSGEDYVRIAVQAARDLPRLAQTRASLRERLAKSVIGDGARYTAAVEAVYRSLWRRWCESRA